MNTFNAIADMVKEAERHADDLSKDRVRAVEYYRGEMNDLPSDEGRSSLTTREVRSSIRKVLPSVMRTILGNDEVVEFQPFGPEDDETSQQASDYMNFVVLAESDARDAIYDAAHDALLLRNGIIKWWWDERTEPKVTTHTGLSDEQLLALAGEEGVEVVEHSATVEETEEGPVSLNDVKIRRLITEGEVKVAAVPRERFLIHPDAVTLQGSLLTGEVTEDMTRSDLIAMGYDRDLVMDLPLSDDDDYEETVRREAVIGDTSEAVKANEKVTYYDLFIRIDLDGDGISELRHMCFAGGLKEKNLLLNEEVDEVQFCDLCAIRQPHQWEGVSQFDDLQDVQKVNTVFLRQTADNLYWQNNPQPMMQSGAIENPEAVYAPEFGLPIEVKRGIDVRQAMGFQQVPFVAKDSFAMMEFMRQEAQDRTGISDASSGMAPDALQNMTAKASAMIEQAGIGQTELMVKNLAGGLRVLFKGLLKLIVRHQDKKRTVRLRGEWVEYDPRSWNADMDVMVNTGLGAGTRERDMMMMQQVILLQEKVIAGLGPDNPFVKPDNLYNSMIKLTEAAGLRNTNQYFNEPDPEEVEAKLEAMRNAPDPEQMKLQAEQQMKQAEVQMQMQIEEAKLQADLKKAEMQAHVARDKEMAQMEADLKVKEADRIAKAQHIQMELEADKVKEGLSLQFEREKLTHDEQMKREEMAFQAQIEAIKVSGQPKEGESQPDGQQDAFMSLAEGMMQAATAPKRVVRDENGDVVGVETVLN